MVIFHSYVDVYRIWPTIVLSSISLPCARFCRSTLPQNFLRHCSFCCHSAGPPRKTEADKIQSLNFILLTLTCSIGDCCIMLYLRWGKHTMCRSFSERETTNFPHCLICLVQDTSQNLRHDCPSFTYVYYTRSYMATWI